MKIICNSWPKAGTHVLLEFSRIILQEGEWYQEVDIKYSGDTQDLLRQVDARIAEHKDNFAIKGHFPWSPDIERALLDRGFKVLFIVRDPRDVLCSTLRWLRDLRTKWEVSQIIDHLRTDDQRLSVVIEGLPRLRSFTHYGTKWHKPMPARYEMLTPWADSGNCCLVKYEYLTGNAGAKKQLAEVERTLGFLDMNTSGLADAVCNGIKNKDSATFHTGKSGNWRDSFTPSHCRMFVDLGGEALIERFGYDKTPVDPLATWESTEKDVALQVKKVRSLHNRVLNKLRHILGN